MNKKVPSDYFLRCMKSRVFEVGSVRTVACNMLRAIGHPVATCYDTLNAVGSVFKLEQF